MPRDLLILIYVTIPLALVAGTLFVLAEWFSSGWDGLSRVIWGAGVVALWALIVWGYCGWIVLRDGMQASSILPALVVVAGAGSLATLLLFRLFE